MNRIAIIGAGAWGTALAVVAHRAGCAVIIRAHEPEVVATISASQENPLFLPGVRLDPAIRATTEFGLALDGADAVLLAVPAQHLGEVVQHLARAAPAGRPLVICAKGIECGSLRLMSEVVASLAPAAPLAVLSGPTFAVEVAQGLPTAVTLAARDRGLAAQLVATLATPSFRPYASTDLVGAQIGGAVKNVLAIACGIVEGRGLGANARAALMTRGLAEMVRLGEALGGRRETLMGLSGLGDLALTCNSDKSRNMTLGIALGRGLSLDAALAGKRSIAEGVASAEAVSGLAAKRGIDMPIAGAVDAILHHDAEIDATVRHLLDRPLKSEI